MSLQAKVCEQSRAIAAGQLARACSICGCGCQPPLANQLGTDHRTRSVRLSTGCQPSKLKGPFVQVQTPVKALDSLMQQTHTVSIFPTLTTHHRHHRLRLIRPIRCYRAVQRHIDPASWPFINPSAPQLGRIVKLRCDSCPMASERGCQPEALSLGRCLSCLNRQNGHEPAGDGPASGDFGPSRCGMCPEAFRPGRGLHSNRLIWFKHLRHSQDWLSYLEPAAVLLAHSTGALQTLHAIESKGRNKLAP